MSMHEEFEVDYMEHFVKTGIYQYISRQDCFSLWKACADRYEEKITEIMIQSKNQAEDWIAHLKEMQAMIEKLETTAKQQAEELAALRGFVESMLEYQDKIIIKAVLREYNAFGLKEYFDQEKIAFRTKQIDDDRLSIPKSFESAVLKERERCLNIVQNNQCRNGYHIYEGTTLGHYDMKMIDEIKKGE